jgi:hypothetical protein
MQDVGASSERDDVSKTPFVSPVGVRIRMRVDVLLWLFVEVVGSVEVTLEVEDRGLFFIACLSSPHAA